MQSIAAGAEGLRAAHRRLRGRGVDVSWTTFFRRVTEVRAGTKTSEVYVPPGTSARLTEAAFVAKFLGVSTRTALRNYDHVVSARVAVHKARQRPVDTERGLPRAILGRDAEEAQGAS